MSSKHDQDDAPILLETPHVGGVAAPDPVEQVLESVRIPVTGSVPSLPQLATATVVAFDVATDALTLRVGGVEVPASRDASVHPIVLEGAAARGERVLIERIGDAFTVVGAVRTQPTPGIDRAPSYAINADRIHLAAEEELSLTARTASVVLRALGEVETFSDRIISRAEGVHKIIGRMLRLN